MLLLMSAIDKALEAPVVKVITAHPIVTAGVVLVMIFLALLIDALVAAFTPTHRGVGERVRALVDRVVGGVQRVTAPPTAETADTAGRG